MHSILPRTRRAATIGLGLLVLVGCHVTTEDIDELVSGDTMMVYPDTSDRTGLSPYPVRKMRCPNPTTQEAQPITLRPGHPADSLTVDGHTLVVPAGAVRQGEVTFRLIHRRHARHLKVEARSDPAGATFDPPLLLRLSYTGCEPVEDPSRWRIIREDDTTDMDGRPTPEQTISTPLQRLSTYVLATPS